MSLLGWVRPTKADQELLEMARKVAAESQTLVWPLIAPRVGHVRSVPEARAYLCVRARRVVRHQMYRLMDRRQWSVPDREVTILDRALALLADQFAGRMLQPQPSHATRRAA